MITTQVIPTETDGGHRLADFASHLSGNAHQRATDHALLLVKEEMGENSKKNVMYGSMQSARSKKTAASAKTKAQFVSIVHSNTPSTPSNNNLRQQRTSSEPKKEEHAGATRSGTRDTAPARLPRITHTVDDVVDFLKEVGLSPTLAYILRQAGITDAARMRALGRVPDALLDRLECSLGDAGLDLVGCLLVREGLKRRAIRLL